MLKAQPSVVKNKHANKQTNCPRHERNQENHVGCAIAALSNLQALVTCGNLS